MAFDFNILFRFWFLLILNILSILCSIFVLYHLLFDRTLRQALNNHIIIVLVIINFVSELIDIPFILNFFRFGSNWKLTVSFSQFWTFIDYGFYSTQIILFAWATIERHILIFHDRWLLTKMKRIIFHYLPIIIIIIYCFIYYLIVIVFRSCKIMNLQSPINGVPSPCLYENMFFLTWDLLCHQIIPTCIIAIFSIGLFIRVLYKKARLHQTIGWRKQRKMAIQLLCITILFQLLNFPWALIMFCQIIKLPVDADGKIFPIAYFLPYYLICIFPFVCCGTLPELEKKLKKLLFWQRHRVIRPSIIAINPIQSAHEFRRNT